MKKRRIFGLAIILIFLIQNSLAQELTLLKTTPLPYFSATSSLTFFNGRLYAIGDDAPKILVLDKDHVLVDSIQLFRTKKRVIPKNEKADLESSFLINKKKATYLVALSSFSASNRNTIVSINISTKKRATPIIKNINASFKIEPVKEVNIEGAEVIQNKMILANRANATHKNNYLIIAPLHKNNFLKLKSKEVIEVLINNNKDIKGISGLAYEPKNDLLLLTISTENTASAIADGAIGESYIAGIKNISNNLSQPTIEPDFILPLTKALKTNSPQKIEAVTIESVMDQTLTLHLSADNDNAQSRLFKMLLQL